MFSEGTDPGMFSFGMIPWALRRRERGWERAGTYSSTRFPVLVRERPGGGIDEDESWHPKGSVLESTDTSRVEWVEGEKGASPAARSEWVVGDRGAFPEARISSAMLIESWQRSRPKTRMD